MSSTQAIPVTYAYPVESHPTKYWVYQSLLFVRSAIILLVVGLFEIALKRNPHCLPVIFRSLKVDTRSMRVFNIVTSGGDAAENLPGSSKRVLSSCCWVVRIALVLVVCYMWENVGVMSRQYDMENLAHRNDLTEKCGTGWDCYTLKNLQTENSTVIQSFGDFWRISFIWDLASMCDDYMLNPKGSFNHKPRGLWTPHPSETRKNAVTCFKPSDNEFSGILAALGVAFATFQLVVISFEVLTALLLRHKRSRFNASVFIDFLIIFSSLGWIAFVVGEALASISTWVSRLSFLAIPLVLWQARRVSRVLRDVQSYRSTVRAKRLQETELGLELDKILRGGQREASSVITSTEMSPTSQRLHRLRDRGKKLKMRNLLAKFRKAETSSAESPGFEDDDDDDEDPPPPPPPPRSPLPRGKLHQA